MLKKATASFVAFALILLLLPATASAACSHPSLGVLYSDAAHPHAYFKYCLTCNAKVYTGGYASKAHGNGAYGSGTCPSCGSHSYVGRSCTSPGTCACGSTIPASGHSYGSVIYSEASHPHAYFKYCSYCSAKYYTGGYETKAHGDGTWGSGTCPSCGTHTFVGTSCTGAGTCACGATTPAYGHTYGSNDQYEVEHPHENYNACVRCGDKRYTWSTTKLPHETCKECPEGTPSMLNRYGLSNLTACIEYADRYATEFNSGVYGIGMTTIIDEDGNRVLVKADCANYVNQCLRAGGFSMDFGDSSELNIHDKLQWWHMEDGSIENSTDTWRGAISLGDYLQAKGYSTPAINSTKSNVYPGNPVWTKDKNHVAICVGYDTNGRAAVNATPVINGHTTTVYHQPLGNKYVETALINMPG